jgi:uncharacterized protein DUF5996
VPRSESIESVAVDAWPPLPLDGWQDTYATLHMWTQVVGKLALALSPLTNHYWNTALQITPRGLATLPLTVDRRLVTVTFDFVAHQLVLESSDGREATVSLEPRPVAEFYRLVMEALARLEVRARIWTMPVEVPTPIYVVTKSVRSHPMADDFVCHVSQDEREHGKASTLPGHGCATGWAPTRRGCRASSTWRRGASSRQGVRRSYGL